MREMPPCKDCTDRHPACHGQCEKYKAWKANQDAIKEAERLRRARSASTYAFRRAKWRPRRTSASNTFGKHVRW